MAEKRTKPWGTADLAKAAKVSDAYIRQLLIAGDLQGDKIGKTWIIPAEVGQAWLDKRQERWDKF